MSKPVVEELLFKQFILNNIYYGDIKLNPLKFKSPDQLADAIMDSIRSQAQNVEMVNANGGIETIYLTNGNRTKPPPPFITAEKLNRNLRAARAATGVQIKRKRNFSTPTTGVQRKRKFPTLTKINSWMNATVPSIPVA